MEQGGTQRTPPDAPKRSPMGPEVVRATLGLSGQPCSVDATAPCRPKGSFPAPCAVPWRAWCADGTARTSEDPNEFAVLALEPLGLSENKIEDAAARAHAPTALDLRQSIVVIFMPVLTMQYIH